jgi:hypothetical protein
MARWRRRTALSTGAIALYAIMGHDHTYYSTLIIGRPYPETLFGLQYVGCRTWPVSVVTNR